MRKTRAGAGLARIQQFFKRDSCRLVKGTVPDHGLNTRTERRYNFFSPRPRVVFFHLFLRGSRAAFFLPAENHFKLMRAAEWCVAENAMINVAGRYSGLVAG